MAAKVKVAIPFPPLVEGTLLRRYKRFTADVLIKDGSLITAHTANTGRMTTCSEPGRKVYLSRSNNPLRKYPYTWELIEMDHGLVGVNTSLPNKLARLALEKGLIPNCPVGGIIKPEYPLGSSRIDLFYFNNKLKKPSTYIEVKNCTLVESGVALFPDAVSSRGTRHLLELMETVPENRGIILILVQRGDASIFSPADGIDPLWGQTLRKAVEKGVELLVREVKLSTVEAVLGPPMEVKL
ncbi:MAG: DNA/RNA nuclease SfsA [Deltaproteobacteria bacterium]|jgi:sugar fermentation stimulation protein A|nr:DNA/RNA nuclease SfsA [Deltaproteobacteria bacterium]